MSTKADLLESWVKWTGDELPEARHRIRALAENGLLPRRQQPVSYADIARTLLGFTAATQHKDAAEAVRDYSEYFCKSSRWLGNKPPSAAGVALFPKKPLLLEALIKSLQPPFRLMKLEVNPVLNSCTLKIGVGQRKVKRKSGGDRNAPDGIAILEFGLERDCFWIPYLLRVGESRFVLFPLVDMLLTDLMGHPAPDYVISSERKGADLPEATSRNDPSEPETNQWVWPAQFNDPQGVYHHEPQ